MRGEKTEHVGLLAASAAGDRLAFAALVREYHPLLYRLALHWLGSKRYLADDAMQEAFVAVWRGAHSYLGTGSERAWILSVARRAIMRMHRHKVGEPTHMEDIDALGAKAGMGDRSANVRVLEQLENQDAVRTAFAKLSDHDKEVLAMMDIEGLAYEEGALVLEISLESLKSRLHRARLHMVAQLKAQETSDAT